MKRYGLVGYPLGHSFSQKYFSKKFKKLNISHSHRYDVFEIESLKTEKKSTFQCENQSSRLGEWIKEWKKNKINYSRTVRNT